MRWVLLPQQLLCAVLPARLQSTVPCAVQQWVALPDPVLLHIALDLQSIAFSVCCDGYRPAPSILCAAAALEPTQQDAAQ